MAILKLFTERSARRSAFRVGRVWAYTSFVSLLCCGAMLAGCSKDLSYEDVAPELPELPQVEPGKVSLSISVPGITTPSGGTYALTPEQEGFVEMGKFNALLFRSEAQTNDDSKFAFVRYAAATEVGAGTNNANTQGHYVKRLSIELPEEADGTTAFYKVMIVANYLPETDATDDEKKSAAWERMLAGKTLPEARGLIYFEQVQNAAWVTSGDNPTPLPLWGETSRAFTSQVMRVSTIPMLRAVARIDVGVNIGGRNTDGDGNFTGTYDLTSTEYNGKAMDLDGRTFEIESVTLYNAAYRGLVAPSGDNYSANLRSVTAPTLPGTGYQNDASVKYTADGTATNMLRRQIYLPETQNKGIDANEQAFYIVIGGRYNGGAVTYYRVDFYNRAADADVNQGQTGTEHENYVKPSAANRYDILRNHAYVINILRVRGEGYPTEAMAASAESSNMEVDIRSWDTGEDLANVVTDGQYRLALSTTQLQYHQDGTAQEVDVFTDFAVSGSAELVAASGWKLYMAAPQNIGGQDQTGAVKVWAADDTELTPTLEAASGRYFWTSGPANQTATLRIGMERFDENNNTGFMERSVRLTFTAGRMTQDVELVQDVKNTRTLTLLQEKFFFVKYPESNQSLIVKSTPAGATYYAVWTRDGQTYRCNISDPDAAPDADIAAKRKGYLGGLNNVAADKLPVGFGPEVTHDGGALCPNVEFFRQVGTSGDMFSLRPCDWDAAHNNNTEPAAPRSWRFEIEAYWDEGGVLDENPEITRVEVEQSNYEVKWYPVENGVQLPDNHITVDWNQSATANISTTPTDLTWYFISKSDQGNLSGQEWVLNWTSDLFNKTKTGPQTIGVTLANNMSLYPRTVTLVASSAADGFDKNGSKLVITQLGGPLSLTLEAGANVAELPYDAATKTYTLDYGANSSRTIKGINVRANSDWWWRWRTDKSSPADDTGTELGEKDMTDAQIATYLDKYNREAIPLHHDHPYWQNAGATPSGTAPGYVVSDWLPSPSVVREPGVDNATTGNRDEQSFLRLWDQALLVRSVQGVYLAPAATTDQSVLPPTRTIPLAGRYYSEIQLFNTHNLYDVTDPDIAAEKVTAIADESKILRIQRTVPSMMTFVELPFDANNNINLSNFVENGTATAELKNQRLTVRSNNKVTITLYKAVGKGAAYTKFQQEKTYLPRQTSYGDVLDFTLDELVTTEFPGFIDWDGIDYDNPYTRYKVVVSGYRQASQHGADEAFSVEREYFSGYYMEHPATAQITRHGQYSSAGFDLLLDFRASAYHKDQRIRVGRMAVNISSAPVGNTVTSTLSGVPEYTEYRLDASQYQCYVRHTVPQNGAWNQMYIYWVEYQKYGTNAWTMTWDGGTASRPNQNEYLFLQDAKSAQGCVYITYGGTTIPDVNRPGSDDVSAWRDKGFLTVVVGSTGDDSPAAIDFNPIYKTQYSGTYADQWLSGESYNWKYNEAPTGKTETAVVAGYYEIGHTGTRHYYKGMNFTVTGHHRCFGSRRHQRSVAFTNKYNLGWWSSQGGYIVKCPVAHSVYGHYTEFMQEINTLTGVSLATEAGNVTDAFQMITARNAVTVAASPAGTVNQSLLGTKIN